MKTISATPKPLKGAEYGEEPLRVAVITAFLLGAGGAEKQAFYIARSLAQGGVKVLVCTLHDANYGGRYGVHSSYHDALRQMDIELKCFGWMPGLPFRLVNLLAELRGFRPHIIQSIHAYTNVYAAIASRVLGAISLGGLRSDLSAHIADNGRFSSYLLTWPDAIAVNSHNALEQVKRSGLLSDDRVHLLPNAIDLQGFPERSSSPVSAGDEECMCICVTRLFPYKRVDVFLRALAAARASEPRIRGVVAGFGPEEERLRKLAAELNLLPDAVSFLGYRDDVAALLQRASVFVLCSESEGTPNVILEAMAAHLPVITTPAGDAAEVVKLAGIGYVVPFGDVNATAAAMVELARTPALRFQLGTAGRRYVSRHRTTAVLAGQLLKIYSDVARTSMRGCAQDLLDHVPPCPDRL